MTCEKYRVQNSKNNPPILLPPTHNPRYPLLAPRGVSSLDFPCWPQTGTGLSFHVEHRALNMNHDVSITQCALSLLVILGGPFIAGAVAMAVLR